ncbi:MAG: PAS domain-containing sensor histidine kinase [Pseudomonadota bacterium]
MLIPLVILGPALAILTVVILGDRDGAGADWLRTILYVDIAYLLAFGMLLALRIANLLSMRRAGRVGSKLHLRLAGTFATVALIPTVIVAIFATLSVNFGVESWFSERVGSVVGNALEVARAYEREHRENIRGDVLAMANDLNRAAADGGITGAQLNEIVVNQAILRELPEAFVFNSDREIVARGEFSYLFSFEPPTDNQVARARAGEVVITQDDANNEIRALVYLTNFFDAFLYVSRDVEGEVLRLLDETQDTVRLYEQLEAERGSLLRDFAIIYVGFALLVICSATLLGFWFAERLARPVGRLAGAAERIGRGDLDVRVKEERGGDEISILSRSFNRMASELKGQRDALIAANRETERRRRLTEAVLSGVTAGVLGLDEEGCINLVNEAATALLDIDAAEAYGEPLTEVATAFLPLLEAADRSPSGVGAGEVRLMVGGQQREFLCRVAMKSPDAPEEGHVITFDDITALASAQRMAAWGDVARRIAHEIKNPLTPIQLSADRMRRKFAGRLGEEGASVERMLDVITRQAGEIRRMVDAFSRFARMPEPDMGPEDLGEMVREAVLLQEGGGAAEAALSQEAATAASRGQPCPEPHAPIAFELHLPKGPVPVTADRGLLGQCLTNLLQNAADAIESRREQEGYDGPGLVRVSLIARGRGWRLDIADNGIGLPDLGRDRLTDPYVTTRKKGTGLGLAIVQKIVEQHGGTLALGDAPSRGAKAGPSAASDTPPDAASAATPGATQGAGPDDPYTGAQVTLRLPRSAPRGAGHSAETGAQQGRNRPRTPGDPDGTEPGQHERA